MTRSSLCFTVFDRNISVIRHQGWMTRPDIILSLFKHYFNNRPPCYLPEISIDLSDDSSDNNFIPGKTFSISADKDHLDYLIPDPYSLCWPEASIDDTFQKCNSIALAGLIPPVDNRVFWIGQNSHWTRKVLVDISKKYPDKINANFLEWQYNIIPQEQMVSLEEHTKYKYLIDASGQGFSARIKYLMFSRRPLFIIDRDYHDWISCELIPWVHYIPVSDKNLEEDLLNKLKWAEKNSNEAQDIAENAYEHISQKLTLENIFLKLDNALRNTIQLI